MKFMPLLMLAVLTVPARAAPVHVALKSAVSVAPDADGFFNLGSVADLSGGEAAARTRLLGVSIGRAPLPGEIRRLTRGDIALKLRQAGCDPDRDAVLEGAAQAEVTIIEGPPAPILGSQKEPASAWVLSTPHPAPQNWGGGAAPLIHRGDAVTIVIQSGALTITAPGLARENGAVGANIRVHREGVMTDLTVIVLDAKTVQLEI